MEVRMIGITYDRIASIITRGEPHTTNQVDFSRKIAIGVGAFKSQGPKHADRHRVEREFCVRVWKSGLKNAILSDFLSILEDL
jgi:hypothetical protein